MVDCGFAFIPFGAGLAPTPRAYPGMGDGLVAGTPCASSTQE